MANLKLNDTIFTSGVNQGIDSAVLPLPQLTQASNVRLRKGARWGKRFGSSALPLVNRTGTALGNGAGNIRTCGPGFAIVDDQCTVYDASTSTWVDPRTVVPVNASQSWTENGHVPGTVSGWLPDTAFFPLPPKSQQNQFSTACAQAYAFGCLWTAMQFTDPLVVADQMIRVVATDANQVVVCKQDFRATTTNQGGLTYPKLVVCGTTLVLVCGSRLSGGGAGAAILAFRATSITGFGTAVAPVTNVASTFFDAIPHTSTDFLLGWWSGGTNLNVATIDSTSLAQTNLTAWSDAYDTAVSLTLACAGSGQPVYATFGIQKTAGSLSATRVRVINQNLVGSPGTATVSSNESYTAYSVPLPGGGVRTLYGFSYGTGNEPVFYAQDVSATGTLGTFILKQWRMQPISRPALIGGRVYVWCTDTNAAQSYGYAHLIRIPSASEFVGTFSTGEHAVACPVEIAAQDYLVATAPPSIDAKGIPAITQIGTTAAYACPMPVLMGSIPGGFIFPNREFRVVQAKHYTDSPAYRSVQPISTNGVTLLPGGVLTRIDQRGAVEAGFFLTPQMAVLSKSSGGLMTPSSSYNYKAVYRVRNANGLFELSSDSDPLTVTLGASETKVTLAIETLEVGARENVQLEIYRTFSNGSIYYLLAIVDGGLDPIGNGEVGYVDTLPDTSLVASTTVIYTQVGNQIPNSCPPPCRFGTVGGQRVFLGGLLRGEIAHASKLMIGDQSPTWCDSDQFRVVFPGKLTGLGWMDNLVGFTAEGIYVVSGDGPDDSGVGEFSSPVRMPYALGCIEPRSVITIDEGTFFQSARGLYLLPRGFGAPIPAGDVVMDTLAESPIITGVAYVNKPGEQTIRWSCVNGANPGGGSQIVYDVAHKVWSVDFISTAVPQTSMSQWLGNEIIMAGPSISTSKMVNTTSTFDDYGQPIWMILQTGDIRPFNLVGHGIIEKLGLLAELRSASTVFTTVSSDKGSQTVSHNFTGIAPDYTVGQNTYTEINLGLSVQRDVNSLRIKVEEQSTVEGLAFKGFTLQNEEETQGFALLKAADRGT